MAERQARCHHREHKESRGVACCANQSGLAHLGNLNRSVVEIRGAKRDFLRRRPGF